MQLPEHPPVPDSQREGPDAGEADRYLPDDHEWAPIDVDDLAPGEWEEIVDLVLTVFRETAPRESPPPA